MLDINHIREVLNELPFRDGIREVFVGRISEMFEGESERTIAEQLGQYEQELRSHTLKLTRHEGDRDALFVVQELRALPPDVSWMAEGMNWVSKITTVALEMVLPGLAGLWLNNQLDTRFATRHNPVIRDYYQHLQQQGKAKKVALIACMRKLLIRLNALMAEPQNA